MSPAARPTWLWLSRVAGLAIVTATLSAMLAGVKLDEAVTLVLLAIAAGLLGLPGGYALVLRKNNSNGGKSTPPDA